MIGVAVLCSVVVEKTERGPLSAKIAVTRTDHTAESLRKLALSHKHRACRRRLRALSLMIEDTLSRSGMARRVGVDVQTLRDWVVRHDAAGVEGLCDAARSGRPPKLDSCQEAPLVAWMDAGPDPDAGAPSCWTVGDIRHWIKSRLDMDFTLEGVRRMIRRLDFRPVPPRPIHPRPIHPWARPEDQEPFRQDFRELALAALPDGVSGEDVLVFFQDEARMGQKGMLSRVWARKGTRPRLPPWLRLSVLGSRPCARTCLRQGQHRRNEPPPAGCQQLA